MSVVLPLKAVVLGIIKFHTNCSIEVSFTFTAFNSHDKRTLAVEPLCFLSVFVSFELSFVIC